MTTDNRTNELTEFLEEQKRLAEDATPGPWGARHRKSLDWLSEASEDETHQPGSGVATAGAVDAHISSLWPNRNARADAEFIAAARSAVPRMIAALEAVMAMHKPYMPNAEERPSWKVCDSCLDSYEDYVPWPCATAHAIEAELIGGEGE